MSTTAPVSTSSRATHWWSTTNAKAGLLYLLPALAVLLNWWILLFYDNPPNITPSSTLNFVLTEEPQRLWFRWLIVLPALCLVLSAAYFSRVAQTRRGAIALLVVGIALALAAWLSVTHELALFVSLPLLYGLSHVRQVTSQAQSR